MRVLVVDDHEFVRRGVRSLLLSQSNYEVCGEAVDGQDALEKARELKPDVIVMDVSMPRLKGLEATRLIRSMLPDSEVLILTQHESSQMLKEAVKAGARGYVVKSSISKDLLTALADVGQHKPFFDASIQTVPTDPAILMLRKCCHGARLWNRPSVKVRNFIGVRSIWRRWELRM